MTELRLCEVHGELCYFHCFECYPDKRIPSITVGNNIIGTVLFVKAIVEFPNGKVKRVNIEDITFCDGINRELSSKNAIKSGLTYNEWRKIYKGEQR